MLKSNITIGFISAYLGLIAFNFCCHYFLFEDVFSSVQDSAIAAVAKASLVEIAIMPSVYSDLFTVYSIISTQIAGLFWLSTLLWFYRQIFRSKPNHSLKDAFVLTMKISLLVESALLVIFIYSLPTEIGHTFSQIFLNALALSISSFNNAGIAHMGIPHIVAVIDGNFLLQAGILLGSVLGGLGIFVIDELFAPANLRYRMSNPKEDWSLVTKTAVFGVIVILSICSLIFFLTNPTTYQTGDKLIESIAAAIFDVNSARGFGHFIYTDHSLASSISIYFVGLIGAVPFSPGGGITLLIFTGIISKILVSNSGHNHDWSMAYQLSTKVLVQFTSLFLILTLAKSLTITDFKISGLLHDQWLMFCSIKVAETHSNLLDVLTIIFGRICFPLSCMLILRQKR